MSHAAQELLKLQKQLSVAAPLKDKSKATGDWAEAAWLEFDWLPQVTHHIPIRQFYDAATTWLFSQVRVSAGRGFAAQA